MTGESDVSARSGRLPFRIEPSINMGQIVVAAVLIISASTVYMGRVDTNQSDTKAVQSDQRQFRLDVTAQVTELKRDMISQSTALRNDMVDKMTQMQLSNDKQFAMVRMDIANIPGMKERVDQLDKRADKLERVLEETRASGIETTANMNNLLRQIGGAQKIPR